MLTIHVQHRQEHPDPHEVTEGVVAEADDQRVDR
jgi:hypothetical protein